MQTDLLITYLDRLPIHLTLNGLLQGQQSNMDRIFKLQVVFVSLLQKSLGAGRTLPNGSGFPREVAATWIHLVKTRPALEYPSRLPRRLYLLCLRLQALIGQFLGLRLDAIIPTRNQQTDTVRPHASGLGSFLHDTGNVLDKDSGGRVFIVNTLVVGMRDFAGFVNKDSVVGAHSRVHHANVWCNEGDFGQGGRINEG